MSFVQTTAEGRESSETTSSSPDVGWTWQTLQTTGKPTGRHETSLVEYDGMFYMIGGRESRQVDRFDPKTKTWTKMAVTTPLIHHFQPVVLNDKIYMVGAMTGGYPTEPPMDRVQIYDPATDTWSQGDTIPEGRRRGGAGTAVHNGQIYIAAGSPKRGGGNVDTTEVLSPVAAETDQKRNTSPRGRIFSPPAR